MIMIAHFLHLKRLAKPLVAELALGCSFEVATIQVIENHALVFEEPLHAESLHCDEFLEEPVCAVGSIVGLVWEGGEFGYRGNHLETD